MARAIIHSDELIAQFRLAYHYDPITGYVYRNGKISGTKDHAGYIMLGFMYRKYLAHRVIWALVMGRFPADEIDHINRDRSDNRWNNLREATRSQNGANRRLHSNNTTGFRGVSYYKSGKAWQAQISVKGKMIPLGRFSTKEEAAAVYQAKAEEFFGVYKHAE